jgi:hypothetical protein
MSKPRGRPFQPGNKMGKGRPKGSRNKPKAPVQALLDEYAIPLAGKCISMAMQGDRSALRMCMERISPARLGSSIRMMLPPIKTAGDIDKAADTVTRDVGRGKITPAEGGMMMNLLESRSRVIEKVQTESRLETLEDRITAFQIDKAA